MPTLSSDTLFDSLLFTHITSILPLAGLMTPGSRGVPGTSHPRLPITPARFTLHWFPQGLVLPHLSWTSTPEDRFYIIEPAQQLKSKFFGGYAEDFITLGQHQLSDEAVIFAPADESESVLHALNPGYKGQLVLYSNREEAHQMVAKFIAEKKPHFKISIPPAQKVTIQIELDVLIKNFQHMDQSLYDPRGQVANYLTSLIKEACSKTPRPKMVTMEDDVDINEIVAIYNECEVNARDLFRSWETEGFYYGLHEGTLFQRLEMKVLQCVRMSFNEPTSPIPETEFFEVEQLVKEIRHLLQQRNYPREVIDYFEQKIVIDLLEYWLPTLIKISRSSEPAETKLDHLVDMTSRATVLSIQQIQTTPKYDEKIERQPTVQLISQFTGTFFSAYKRSQGLLVDALSRDDQMDPTSRQQVQQSLKKAGIPSYLKKDGSVVVPDINTPMIGNAVRKALGL